MSTWPVNRSEFGENRTPVLIGLSSADGVTIVPVAVDHATGAVLTDGGGGGGGTSSTFGATFPTTGTAVGASNGTNMEPLLVDGSGYLEVNVKAGGGGGTQYQELATTSPATGTLALGRYLSSLPTLTTGEMNEPMLDSSSRLLVSIAAGNITGFATSSNQTNASQKTQIVDGSGNVIASTSNALNVQLENTSVAVTGTFYQATQPVSLATNTPTLQSGSTTAVTQSTASNLNATVVSGNATGSAVPATAYFNAIQDTSGLKGIQSLAYIGGDGISGFGTAGAGIFLWNGTNYDRMYEATTASGTSGTGLAGVGTLSVARTALPTAVTATDYTTTMADKFGRQITIPQAPRDLVGFQETTFTASTGSSTVLTGVASIFSDITSIALANSGASATLFTLSDGTNSYEFYVPAGDMRGAVYQVPLAATTVATNWTGQCGTSTSSLYCTITYIKNR